MKKYLLILLGLILFSSAQAEDRGKHKKTVALWYEAFDQHNPALLDRILSKNWVDIPAAPGQPVGPEGAKHILADIEKSFPDFRIAIKEVFQDGNKVIVRSEINAMQKGSFMGRGPSDRQMTIMAIDVHEFKEGKIVRTWHMEDWMTGLHQLGFFEK